MQFEAQAATTSAICTFAEVALGFQTVLECVLMHCANDKKTWYWLNMQSS